MDARAVNAYREPADVQTLLLSRDYFDKAAAQSWARKYGYESSPVARSEDYYRIRQEDPGKYKRRTFRTIDIAKGVRAVIGRRKNPTGPCSYEVDTFFGAPPQIEITTTTKDKQTSATVKKMAKLARKSGQTYPIRHLATRITAAVPSGDRTGELTALYKWVRDNIRYRFDPAGLEWLQTPERTLKERAGDCDCLSTLLAALAQSLGHPIRFRTVGPTPKIQKHIALEAYDGKRWISLDPVLEPPGNPNAGEPGRLGARAKGAAMIWRGKDGRLLKGANPMTLGRPVPVGLLPLIPQQSSFPGVPTDPAPPLAVPIHTAYRAKRWDRVQDQYLQGLYMGDIFTDILKTATSFIPGVGPVVSSAIGVGEQLLKGGKKKKKGAAAPVMMPGAGAGAAPVDLKNIEVGIHDLIAAQKKATELAPLNDAINRMSAEYKRTADMLAHQAETRETRALSAEARAISASNELARARATARQAAALKKAAARAEKAAKKAATKQAKAAIKKAVAKANKRAAKALKAAQKAAKAAKKARAKPYKGKAIQVYDPKTRRYKVYALSGIRPSLTLALGAAPVAPYSSQKTAATRALSAIKTFQDRHSGKPPSIALPAVKAFQVTDDLLKQDGLYGSNTRTALAWYLGKSQSSLPPIARALQTAITWIAPTQRAKPAAEAPKATAGRVALAKTPTADPSKLQPAPTRPTEKPAPAPAPTPAPTKKPSPIDLAALKKAAEKLAKKAKKKPSKKAKRAAAKAAKALKAARKKAKAAPRPAPRPAPAPAPISAAPGNVQLAIPQVLAIEQHVPAALYTSQKEATAKKAKSLKAAKKKIKQIAKALKASKKAQKQIAKKSRAEQKAARKAARKAIKALKSKVRRAARRRRMTMIGETKKPIPGVARKGGPSNGIAIWILVGLALARR